MPDAFLRFRRLVGRVRGKQAVWPALRRHRIVLRHDGADPLRLDALRHSLSWHEGTDAHESDVDRGRHAGLLSRRAGAERIQFVHVHDRSQRRIPRWPVAQPGASDADRVQRVWFRPDSEPSSASREQAPSARHDGVRLRRYHDDCNHAPVFQCVPSVLFDRMHPGVLSSARVSGRGGARRRTPQQAACPRIRGAARRREGVDANEEPVLFDRVARHSHAAQRDHRLFGSPRPGCFGREGAKELHLLDQVKREGARAPRQRHARPLEDGMREAGDHRGDDGCRQARERGGSRLRDRQSAKVAYRQDGDRRGAAAQRRPAAHQADIVQPAVECVQVYGQRHGHGACALAG